MEKKEKTPEPIERFQHRMACKSLLTEGICALLSSKYSGAKFHITLGCAGRCRRMKLWDSKHGYKDREFKLRRLY